MTKFLNLFGEWEEEPEQQKRKNYAVPSGYAWMPGTGPEGRCCKHCKFFFRKEMGKTYFKCEKVRKYWTGGSGTDIKANAKTCRLFKEKQNERK